MKDMIQISKDFQYSINIGYDLNDKNKIENFIPTVTALEFIEKIMLSISDASTNRARILIGAYGKGKSHLVLVVLALLFQKDKEQFKTLLSALKKYNADLYQYVNDYIDGDKRLLPIVINGSNSSLSQSFMMGLQRTLSENDMLDIMPETNFEAAIKTIYKWESEYPDVYQKMITLISKPIKDFVKDLKNYSNDEYNEFTKIYPDLTAGSTFNPFSETNVVELYEKAAKAVSKKGYNGLYVVYDEFSKYLESNITTATINDIKMLQDFAEKSSRSGENQIHLMLISHKEIANYIDKLPKQKVDGWRGVSERFEHNILQNDYEQTYEVMAHVLTKNEKKWKEFVDTNNILFDKTLGLYSSEKMFENIKSVYSLLQETYPLHPVSMYILPRMSEKVAQNERTLFTFLAADGTGTLKRLIPKSEAKYSLVTPDVIYDYFSPQMRKEAYTSELHSIYKLANNVIQKIKNQIIETKIVKTIALIYALEQFEVLAPTLEQIEKIFSSSYNVEEIESAINSLIEQHYVVYLKRSNSFLKLKESTGIDVKKEIHDFTEKIKNQIAPVDVLNNYNLNAFLYPTGYNDEYEITRFFKFEFLTANDINLITDWNAYIDDFKADGIVIGVVLESDDSTEEVRNTIQKISTCMNRVVFVLPKKHHDINEILLEFNAVNCLKDKVEDDEILFDEYEMISDDLHEIVSNFIQEYLYPNSAKVEYYYEGELRRITRKAQLTRLLSGICENIFDKTPIINNEVINKNEISTVALNSRTKIVQALLRTELEPNLGLAGNGQEISIMRSLLILPGVLMEEDGETHINLQPEDLKIRRVLEVIQNFFEKAKTKSDMNFKSLYSELMSAEYGYGLKRGVIPIYLTAVLHEYKQYIAIKERQSDLRLSASAINQIDARPEEFTIIVENWNEEKELFISKMESTFSEYIIQKERLDNNYSFVVAAIKRWYLSLPKYTKEMESYYKRGNFVKVEKSKSRFLKLLKQPDVGEQELLFEKIPKCFGYSEFTISVIDNIEATKVFFDSSISQLEKELAFCIEKEFGKENSRASLYSIVQDWIESLDPNVKTHLFSNGAEKCYAILSGITNDEHLFISRLAKGVTGLRLEDWNNNIIDAFLRNLKEYKESLEEYKTKQETEDEISNQTGNEYKISFLNNDGSITEKHFEKTEIGKRAKLLKNDIENSIEEMGHSISQQEKRQVIIDVLKKFC